MLNKQITNTNLAQRYAIVITYPLKPWKQRIIAYQRGTNWFGLYNHLCGFIM